MDVLDALRAAYQQGREDWAQAQQLTTEHAVMMSGGGFHVRPGDPETEAVYPLARWIENQSRNGGTVYRRVIIVLDEWQEVNGGGR
jgi:hypothetical protein